MDLSNLSERELGIVISKLFNLQIHAHIHSLLTTWFVDSHGSQFSELMIKLTQDIVKKSGKDIDFAEAFSALTTKPENSIGMQEELESLRVLQNIENCTEAKKIFLGLKKFDEIPYVDPVIKDIILAHYKKWRWTPFTYLGPAYDIDYYLNVWSGLLKEGFDLNSRIAEIEKRPLRVKAHRDELLLDLNIDEHKRKIYDVAADIVFLKGYRKEVFFHGSYVLSKILREIAKRHDLSLNQMYMMSHLEIENLLLYGEKPLIEEINKRQGKSVWHCKDGKANLLLGKEAEEFIASKNIEHDEKQDGISELKGICACPGKAKGRVKVINTPSEMDKMEKGDVMVAHTTFPSLVPAMKKASAIITEDGGMTCHAAIVSREMGTPCITGIKSALLYLEDGVEVDIDAGEGIVKILGGKND
ncbi:hypothetical protein H6503_07030 [Candidatus Woesearchaeota archaeon]|nr:hypothetical protein [Candidatus Woesearchaeota archaeon]